MIDINPVNFLTIGLIAIGAYAAVKFGQRFVGVNIV
jgi:hypothetical protein